MRSPLGQKSSESRAWHVVPRHNIQCTILKHELINWASSKSKAYMLHNTLGIKYL